MPTVREYELALQKDPGATEPFVALRKAYRAAGKHDKLVMLYEKRAQAIEDGAKAGELFYLAAELRLDQLGDPEGAEADLANAVDRDPTHVKATQRLKDIYREQNRTGDYMAMLEMEAAAVAQTRDPERLAGLQNEMQQLFVSHFARLERALHNPQRPGKLTEENVKSIESARKIYRALGDFRSVVRLYELELEATTEAKRRADLLLGLGRVLSEKLGELDAAAQRLGEVVRLRPRDERALELLAAIYANPKWIGADGADRAAGIYYQVARRRHEAGDADNAVEALRKALTSSPGHAESSELLERVYYDAHRFADLDRYYRERVSGATADAERMDFLFKRAQLAEGELGDVAEAQRVYEEIATIEAPGGPAAHRLIELYTAGGDYGKLAELREKELEILEDVPHRVALMQELAALYRDRLGDREQSAVYLHAILETDPSNYDAMQAYAEHFREKNDWPALTDLLEFSCDTARAHGASADELVRRLEEIAAVCEKQLGDTARAIATWQRIEEIAPTYERAREAQKRILQKGKDWAGYVKVWERDAKNATDPAAKAEILRKMAGIHREKLNDAHKAIAIYKEILRIEPHDAVSLRSLVEIYEREGDWDGLGKALRKQLDEAATKQEKISLLRRLLVIYDERLGDLVEGSWAATEILRAVPGDREALTRLEDILDRSDDAKRLVQTLDYHTRYAATAEEKIQLVRRIAELYGSKLEDPGAAAERWEEVLRLAPEEGDALEALAAIYAHLGRPADLARVLDLQIERLADDPAMQAEFLRSLAHLTEGALGEVRRAQRAWEALLEILPADPDALGALSRIYSDKGDYVALADILEKQIPLAGDPATAVQLALQRALLLETKLDEMDEAASVLEQVIAELDPRNLEAHDRLRHLYEGKGDWPRVVKVAERLLFLTEDPTARAERALEIGALWRDRIADQRKAITAFERVLEIAPSSFEALSALAPLYAAVGNAERLIVTDEKLLHQIKDPAERRRLMVEIAETCEESMSEPRLAFEWYRRAYNDAPDAEALALVDRTAETHGLWEELIQVYEGTRARSRDAATQLGGSLKIAVVCEEKLNDPGRAFGVLRDALPSDPAGQELLPELERLADRTRDWAGLLDVYARVARGRPELDDRVDLLRLRAGVREERMNDPSGAMDEFLRSFALQPHNEATQNELLRLAEKTSRWEDALKVQAQLFAQSSDLDAKLEVARKAAALVEEKVKDPVRAFRAYLNAFRLSPEDDDLTGNLWRLAALIKRYEDAPVIPPEAARVLARVSGDATDPRARVERDGIEDADGDDDDVHEVSGIYVIKDGEGSDTSGIFEKIDTGDIVIESERSGEIKLTSPMSRGRAAAPAVASEARPPAALPPPVRRSGPGIGTQFETPWEEFAQAYETLPSADSEEKFVYLLKIEDIWERGQKDIDRALDALERAFKIDSDDEVVRGHLTRLASSNDRWDRVCDIYLDAVDEFGSIERAVGLHHDVARFRETLGQFDKAEQRYRAILSLKPDYGPALDRMEEMYRLNERWTDLAGLLEKRTSGALEALPPGRERRLRYRELAELYESRLEKPYEAIDTLERYVTEAGDDDRGAEHADVVEGTIDAFEALGRLYGRVGLWAKVVETLQREVEITSDRNQARDLRMRVAHIYERELGLPDRAVEAYEGLLAFMPDDVDALGALDRLHEAHGRFDDLQEVLARRAELVEGAERLELVRRRARILEEKLGNPDAAASCIRGLGEEGLHNDDLAAALLRNLRRAGLGHEAARALSQRIDLARAANAKPAKIAELLLELAALRLDDLNDAAGAREAIDAALWAAPESALVLGALARLYLKQSDFRAYAETRVREAEAQQGKPEAVAALLEAGRVFREQVSDPAQAKACFNKALVEDPKSGDALRSLGALLASQGEWAEARALFERQLDVAETPQARAAVLTDIARAVWEGSGDSVEAIKHLDQAVSLAPDHLPAVVTMADIYYKEHQWDQAERRLNEALRRMKGQPEQMARLYYRLAEVYDKLGKLEEGYRILLEADRMTPGQLLIKLSLGENRFRARKWREAAMHLGTLVDHPDAPEYPDEVAEALSHAAQSEVKLRRPERAVQLYESALRLRQDHAPSLRALADLALERGEKREAATFLKRLAEASGDKLERAQLFEQLGDLYVELADTHQARTCYEWAVGMIDKPADGQAPLFEKTLKLQQSEGDNSAAAKTAEALVALAKDPKERAERRRQAAKMLSERGDSGKAAELLEQAVADDPSDEVTLARLCDVYERGGNRASIETLLGKALPGLPAVEDTAEARSARAALWERLGTLRQTTDRKAAESALEKAVEVEPERQSARILLAALYGDEPGSADAAIRNHRALLASDPTRAESLRALGHTYEKLGAHDRARCAYEVLALLGAAKREELQFLEAHPRPTLKPDDPYRAAMSDEDRELLQPVPNMRVLGEILATLWDGSPGLAGQGADAFGVSPGDKISPMSDLDIGKIYGQISKALENKRTSLFVKWDPSHDEVAIAVQPPPALVIGPKLADGSSHEEMRFLLGRALELTRPEFILAGGIKAKEFTGLFAGMLKAFHPRHARKRTAASGDAATDQHAAKLKKSVPYKVSKRLAELFTDENATAFSSTRWRSIAHETANRAGLLVCGDLGTASRLVLREAMPSTPPPINPAALAEVARTCVPLRDLLVFAVSDAYFNLRERLGMATASAPTATGKDVSTGAPTAPN